MDDGERLAPPPIVFGKESKPGPYKRTNPRVWTAEEEAWALEMREAGHNRRKIAEALGRSEASVQLKLKRLTKKSGDYNRNFRAEKYAANLRYLEAVRPASVLDVFAGDSWWAKQGVQTLTNDISPDIASDFSRDAFELLAVMYLQGRKFDVIDLDPFGSAYECFEFSLRLARKGVVVSFGEWGHKRWKRLDFVADRYRITTLETWSEDAFVSEFQRLARLHKKEARVLDSLVYGNFFRVYFLLEPVKKISQWKSLDDA